MCVDYRALSERTKKSLFLFCEWVSTLDAQEGLKLFPPLDLASDYYLVAMKPKDRVKMAFTTASAPFV